MSNQNLTITEKLTHVSERANALCDTVQAQLGNINSTLDNKLTEVDNKMTEVDGDVAQSKSELENHFNELKNNFVEVVNGLEVHKQGRMKRFSFNNYLNSGGWTREADGPDSDFPYCAAPKEPYYINLLEFHSQSNSYGSHGDNFKIDFLMNHRGMVSYADHIVITGMSSSDCVSGVVEIKRIENPNAIKLFISEPGSEPIEIPFTADDVGKSIEVNFRSIGKLSHGGKARITLKIDTRYHCGSTRAFGAMCEYNSPNAGPCSDRVSFVQPSWEQ